MTPHNGIANGVANGIHNRAHEDDGVQIMEEPMGTKRPLKVIFVGMGASGINFAYQLFRKTTNVSLVIYEKNERVGGTWYENRYEGCACDIPSVSYQFTWHPKPDWSKYYSGSDEIHDYLEDIVHQYDLIKYARMGHEIVKAEWMQDRGKWKVTVRHGETVFDDYGDFFINGGGVLNNWRWPSIKGLFDFKGKLMHTANWDRSYDLTGKRVLNIGIGSSGVQVVPNIIERVKELHVVACGSLMVLLTRLPPKEVETLTEIKRRFKSDPKFYLSYRKAIESELNVRFKLILKGSEAANAAKEFSINEMKTKLDGRSDLIDHLMPKDFNVGCRRPTPGNGFLEALTHEKTQVHFGEIQEITPSGFIDKEGIEHEVDLIICATGFDTSFRPTFPILFDGQNIQDQFHADMVGYLGLSAPDIPNYFVFIGPYGPLGHGSILPMIEFYTDYVIQVLEKVQTEYIKRLSVKRSVAEDFTKYADKFLQRTAWTGPCTSWFKDGTSKNKPVLWPGSRIHYLTMLERPRFEHFDFEYLTGNSCSFLGNGFCTRDFDGRDLSWYMGFLDGEDKQPESFLMTEDDGGGKFADGPVKIPRPA